MQNERGRRGDGERAEAAGVQARYTILCLPSYRFLLWRSSMNHLSAHIQLCNNHVQSGKETKDNASSYCKNMQRL